MDDLKEACINDVCEAPVERKKVIECIELKLRVAGREIILTPELYKELGLSTWIFDRFGRDEDTLALILNLIVGDNKEQI